MKLEHTEEVPDYLWEAARVSRFMRDDQHGRWRLRHFSVTEDDYLWKLRMIQVESDHPEMELARAVPPGDYITLQRRMTENEKRDAVKDQFGKDIIKLRMDTEGLTEEQVIAKMVPKDRAWLPIMSDTPAEILEHDHALNRAHGVVVITGLGLGCLPHALLAKGDEIEHIHIIEIDPEVIRLTGKYLKRNPKVTIHKGSALDVQKLLPEGMRADYVWHDIWSHISWRNFHPETAEHRISYGMLNTLYAMHLDVRDTGAWAYREALMQKQKHDAELAEEMAFRVWLEQQPLDVQVEASYDRVLRGKVRIGGKGAFPADRPLPQNIIEMLDPEGELKSHLRNVLSDPSFWPDFHRAAEEKDIYRLDTPNAHLEKTR